MRNRIGQFKIGWSLGAAMIDVVSGMFVVASVAEAKGENVTFMNKSRQAQELLAVFGGDGACADMPEKKNMRIEPGEQMILESGASKVCWCAGSGKIAVTQCGEWKTAKSGSKVRIRF